VGKRRSGGYIAAQDGKVVGKDGPTGTHASASQKTISPKRGRGRIRQRALTTSRGARAPFSLDLTRKSRFKIPTDLTLSSARGLDSAPTRKAPRRQNPAVRSLGKKLVTAEHRKRGQGTKKVSTTFFYGRAARPTNSITKRKKTRNRTTGAQKGSDNTASADSRDGNSPIKEREEGENKIYFLKGWTNRKLMASELASHCSRIVREIHPIAQTLRPIVRRGKHKT